MTAPSFRKGRPMTAPYKQFGFALTGPIRIVVEAQQTAWHFDIKAEEDIYHFIRDDVETIIRVPWDTADSKAIRNMIEKGRKP
jgi:hypothetical protein